MNIKSIISFTLLLPFNLLCCSDPPLHRAARTGNLYLCKKLINNGADINQKNNNGETPLHEAAWRGHKKICHLLIKQNANINEKNKRGDTPLHEAVWNGHKEVCLLLLLHKANINEQNRHGNTPLHLATRKEEQEICKLFIKFGFLVLENNSGQTPFNTTSNSTLIYTMFIYDKIKILAYLKDISPKYGTIPIIIALISSFSTGAKW